MLRTACILLFACSLSQTALPAEYATTDGGRRVLLNENGTWQFVEARPPASSANDDYAGADNVIASECQRQWKDDFGMRAFCEKKQRQALSELGAGKPPDVGESDFRKVRALCADEWPKDFAMRRFCETKQYEAIRELRR